MNRKERNQAERILDKTTALDFHSEIIWIGNIWYDTTGQLREDWTAKHEWGEDSTKLRSIGEVKDFVKNRLPLITKAVVAHKAEETQQTIIEELVDENNDLKQIINDLKQTVKDRKQAIGEMHAEQD